MNHRCGNASDHRVVEMFRAAVPMDMGRSGGRAEGVEPIDRNVSADHEDPPESETLILLW